MGFAGFLGTVPEAVTQVAHAWPRLDGQRTFPKSGLHLQWWNTPAIAEALTWNRTHDVALLLRGELFPDDDASPLQRYEALGPAFVEELNGRFSGVLIDFREPRVLVFNDRYGLGPCHWHQDDQGLYFATSARALGARLQQPLTLDEQSLAETVSMGCVLDHRTLFKGIERLPPGSLWMRTGLDRPRRSTYFSPMQWRDRSTLPESVFHRRMCKVLSRRVPNYLRGPERVGVSLTGGLDGRLVMAWAQAAPDTLPCYSFSGPWRACEDARLAQRVAQACRQSHQTLTVGSELIDAFPALAAQAVVASDGLMDVSGGVEIFVNRLARQIAPVRLTGNWGSEILRGHVAFRPRTLDRRLLDPAIATRVDEAETRYQDARTGDALSFIGFKQVPWHHAVRLSLEESQLTLRSPFLDNDIVALMHRAPRTMQAQAAQATLKWVQQAAPSLASIPTDRALRLGGPAWLQQLQQWRQTFWIKAEYAMDYGMPAHWAPWLRPLGSWHPQRWVLGRHKFYHFRSWYQGPLAGHLRDTLLDSQALSRSVYTSSALRKMVEDHTAGRSNHTLDLHRAWSLELVHQHFLSGMGSVRTHGTEALP